MSDLKKYIWDQLFTDFVVNRYYLIWLLERLIPLNVEPNQTHPNLSVLPWEIVVTTNYDRLMYCAFEQVGKRPFCYNLPDERADHRHSFPTKPDHPLIVHAHGALWLPADRDRVKPIVITESDYYKYLVNMASGVWNLPLQVSKRLAFSSYLFLGYSMTDWTFRLLFYTLQEVLGEHSAPIFAPRGDDVDVLTFRRAAESRYREHFALIFTPPGDDVPGSREFAAAYLKKFVKAKVFFGDAEAFTSELRSRWEHFL